MVMQVTCKLSLTESKIHRLLLYTLIGLMGPLRAASFMAHTATAVTWR